MTSSDSPAPSERSAGAAARAGRRAWAANARRDVARACRVPLLAVIAWLGAGRSAAAQSSDAPSIDFTVGPSTSWGGNREYDQRDPWGFRYLKAVFAAQGDVVRRGSENFRLGSLEFGLRIN